MRQFDIANLLADKDLYVLTSDYEGISIALLEAMSMGLPAIATNVGGVPETVIHNQTGILVAKNDANALAEAIQFFANDRAKLEQYSKSTREFFLKEFEESNFINKYDNIYAS